MLKDKYIADSIISLGYDIYDEWIDKRYRSRKIASSVRLAVAMMRAKATDEARAE